MSSNWDDTGGLRIQTSRRSHRTSRQESGCDIWQGWLVLLDACKQEGEDSHGVQRPACNLIVSLGLFECSAIQRDNSSPKSAMLASRKLDSPLTRCCSPTPRNRRKVPDVPCHE